MAVTYSGSQPGLWYDPSKYDPNNLLASINSIQGMKLYAAAQPEYWAQGTSGSRDDPMVRYSGDPSQLTYSGSNDGGYAWYDPSGQAWQHYDATPDQYLSSNGTILNGYTQDGVKYFTDNYNDPSGKSEKDQMRVTYRFDPATGTATPVATQGYYQPSDWVDTWRPVLQTAAPVILAGIGGAYFGGAGAGAGEGAAVAGTGAASTAAPVTNAALIESGLGTTGYGVSSASTGWASLSPMTQQAIIGALRGGVTSAVTGGNPITGALTGGLTGGITSGMDSGFGKLLTSALISQGVKSMTSPEAPSRAIGGTSASGSGSNDMANSISDWLAGLSGGDGASTDSNWLSSILGSLGSAAGSINPAQLAFANYQLNGAKSDRDAAQTQNNEAQQYLKDQLDRTSGLGDKLTGAVDTALAGDGNWDSILAGIKNGTIDPTTKGFMDTMTALANKREANNDAEHTALQDSISNIGDKAQALYDSWGARKTYTDQDVADASQNIYNQKVGAVDRALTKAASQGFAGALSRGLSDSTQAADTRDDVARRFADTYSSLQADSQTQGLNLIKGLSDLQGSQRTASMNELLSSLTPELNARIQTYKPDNTAVDVAKTNANLAQTDLSRQGSLLSSVANKDQSKLSTLLSALTSTNSQSVNGAGSVASNAAANLQAAMKSLGESRSAAMQALSPAINSLSGGGGSTGGGTLSNLISRLTGGSGGSSSNPIQSAITNAALRQVFAELLPNGVNGVDGLTDEQLLELIGDPTGSFIDPSAPYTDTPDLGGDWSDMSDSDWSDVLGEWGW